jgi:hypothetical protein
MNQKKRSPGFGERLLGSGASRRLWGSQRLDFVEGIFRTAKVAA